MSKDQVIGSLILAASLIGILAYAWLVFFSDLWAIVLRLTGFVAVGGILALMAWIGYTLATTPPPKPIEALESEATETATTGASEAPEAKEASEAREGSKPSEGQGASEA
ncbi:MAG: transcriptional regulator [Candidatus Bathyarchaeia archaeon]